MFIIELMFWSRGNYSFFFLINWLGSGNLESDMLDEILFLFYFVKEKCLFNLGVVDVLCYFFWENFYRVSRVGYIYLILVIVIWLLKLIWFEKSLFFGFVFVWFVWFGKRYV